MIRTALLAAFAAIFSLVTAQTPIFTSASAQRAALDNNLSFNAKAIPATRLPTGATAQAGNVANFPSLALPDVSMAFNLVTIPKGEVVPEHIHPRGTELIFNVRGAQEITIGQEGMAEDLVFRTKPGFYTAIPEGLPHITKCVSRGGCIFSASFNTADPGTRFL